MVGEHSGGPFDGLPWSACRRLLVAQPALEPYFLRVRDSYARAYVAMRRLRNRLRYAAPPNPYRLLQVDPTSIERVGQLEQAMFREAGAVVAGDWDRTVTRFTDLDVYQAYERRFEEGVPWEETAFYDRIVAEIESGDSPWGCASEAAFRERCRRLDRLYEHIAADGYRTQAELAEENVNNPMTDQHRFLTERLKNEIAVHIGREGELLFADGRNRLSIAKLLELESVPVRVLRRHAEWQGVRDAYARGEPAVERFAGHPDLAGRVFGDGEQPNQRER